MRDPVGRQPAAAPSVVDAAPHRLGGASRRRCVFYAFSVLPMAQTYALIFAAPLLITILAIPILGETVGWRRHGGGRRRADRRHRRAAARGDRPDAGHLAALAARSSRRSPRSSCARSATRSAARCCCSTRWWRTSWSWAARCPSSTSRCRRSTSAGSLLMALPRLPRRALPHRRLPHRQRRRRRADAVFADPLGGALRRRLLRRDPGLEHRRSAPRSSSSPASTSSSARTAAGRQQPAGARDPARASSPAPTARIFLRRLFRLIRARPLSLDAGCAAPAPH